MAGCCRCCRFLIVVQIGSAAVLVCTIAVSTTLILVVVVVSSIVIIVNVVGRRCLAPLLLELLRHRLELRDFFPFLLVGHFHH
jgi:hypothetical protein